jgi:osmotically-inducible protein OsmY
LPPRVREGDLQIEQDVRNALRYAAEIAQLGDIEVHVENGTAYLRGTVQSVDDIGRVDEIVGALRNVNQVYSELEVQY